MAVPPALLPGALPPALSTAAVHALTAAAFLLTAQWRDRVSARARVHAAAGLRQGKWSGLGERGHVPADKLGGLRGLVGRHADCDGFRTRSRAAQRRAQRLQCRLHFGCRRGAARTILLVSLAGRAELKQPDVPQKHEADVAGDDLRKVRVIRVRRCAGDHAAVKVEHGPANSRVKEARILRDT